PPAARGGALGRLPAEPGAGARRRQPPGNPPLAVGHRPAALDRPGARLERQLRHHRPRLRLPAGQWRRGSPAGRRAGRPQRQLPAGAAPRGLPPQVADHAQGAPPLDVPKALADRGYPPPTVYFPLIVDEALMVEPTETESVETLDAFADAMLEIAAQAEGDPAPLRDAP